MEYIQIQNLLLNLWYHFVGLLDNFFNSAIKRVTFCQLLLRWALFVCTFLGNFKSFWKNKSMNVLIIITMLTNNSSIFCTLTSSVVMVEQQLEQYLCVTFFGFCFAGETWLAGLFRDSFQLPSFLPDSREPFYNTVSFLWKEESSAGLSTLPVLPGVFQF